MNSDLYDLVLTNKNVFLLCLAIFLCLVITADFLISVFITENHALKILFDGLVTGIAFFLVCLVLYCNFLRSVFYALIIIDYSLILYIFKGLMGVGYDKNYDKAKNFLRVAESEKKTEILKTESEVLPELNFSRVKEIIDKMRDLPLTNAESKDIEKLKSDISCAEKNGFTGNVKGEINDGLSVLLKIMSKYKV